jgi:hypothetical protein
VRHAGTVEEIDATKTPENKASGGKPNALQKPLQPSE